MDYSFEDARSLAAVAIIILICWLLSEDRKRFPWRMAVGCVAIQVALVLALFAIPNSHVVLDAVGAGVTGLADATDKGTEFVFGYLGGRADQQPFPIENEGALFIFGFRVLPLILVISTLSALLWHWRILKWITQGFGFLFERTLGLGGATALGVAANLFMGMVESPIVIRAYLDKLTRSELFLLMVVGLSTVAGSTMIAYVRILEDVLPNAAGHVLVASIISAPAGVLLARIMMPGEPGDGVAYNYKSGLKYDTSMDAAMHGVTSGVAVAVNVASFLIVFVALVWMVNGMLAIAPPLDGEPMTLQRLFAYVFAPVAFMIGVPWDEALKAGEIIGTKLFLTEFIAFIELGAIPSDALSERTRMILTYAVCGFANVAAIGIMSGGWVALMPERRELILSMVWRALLPGFLSTLMSASIVAALPRALFQG